jgi:hypothetical protein
MENLKISRIKAAGKNITNIVYLTLVSIGLSLIMNLHISNLKSVDGVRIMVILYAIVFLGIFIILLINLFSAGKHLINCDNDIQVVTRDFHGYDYKGEWKDNMYHGQGTYTYYNGDKYVGEYMNGKKNGQGTYTYANGTIRKGLWKNDEYVGE